ncbi:MAG TPA: NAD(P)H-dependent glycerol-3-phosphate dehydrogenase [Acidimicrobiales bacterium]|jgi:glycerol-3-phosphate dehydrogenase (NAD(P)+)|nr:NAD(P)H-dependent glycerol-3-phosphate dehydrogenase [Acidimicrobiales bacterium]
MRVTVLGAGSWGTTVASIVARRHDSVLWARDAGVAAEVRDRHTNGRYLPDVTLAKTLDATADLEEAVTGTDVVVVGVPSHGFRQVLSDASPWVRPWIPVVSLTKGLEQGSLARMTQIIEEVLPGHPAAALTGPNLAREIVAGQAAASVIATEDPGVAAALQGVLRSAVFRVYMNHDVVGCEIGGALKNVIAIAAGIAQGLKVGDNTRAAVITRGLAELTRLGVAMGGDAATLAGLAGMGDLMATAMSPFSRNRYVGEQLGAGRPLADILGEMNMVAEGVKTAATVAELADRYSVDLPICRVIHRVVQGDIAASEAYRGLQRSPGHEADPG